MLTPEDLQAIAQLMDIKLEPIKEDIGTINQRLDRIETRTTAIEVTIENKIDMAIKILGEGHQGILDAMAPKHDLEEAESRISTLENVATIHTAEIKELKSKIG